MESDTTMRWLGAGLFWLFAIACLLMMAVGMALLVTPVPSLVG